MLKLSEVMTELCRPSLVKTCPSRRAEPALTIAFSESVGFEDIGSKVGDRISHPRTKHVHIYTGAQNFTYDCKVEDPEWSPNHH